MPHTAHPPADEHPSTYQYRLAYFQGSTLDFLYIVCVCVKRLKVKEKGGVWNQQTSPSKFGTHDEMSGPIELLVVIIIFVAPCNAEGEFQSSYSVA